MPALVEAHPEWNLHVGIGVSVGEVVLGAIGARDRMDFTVLGDTCEPRVAALRCGTGPDAVLVSEAVQAVLAGDPGLSFRPQAPLTLKGRRQPVQVFTALAATGPDAPLPKRPDTEPIGTADAGPGAREHG